MVNTIIQTRLRTDSPEILDILCFEEEIGLASSNAYKKEKLKFLVDELGLDTCISIIDKCYRQILQRLVNNNYETNEHVTGGYSASTIAPVYRKIQKHLQIIYLLNIYNPTVEQGNSTYDGIDTYNMLFGKCRSGRELIDKTTENARLKATKYNNLANIYNIALLEVKAIIDEFINSLDGLTPKQKLESLASLLEESNATALKERVLKEVRFEKFALNRKEIYAYTKKGEIYKILYDGLLKYLKPCTITRKITESDWVTIMTCVDGKKIDSSIHNCEDFLTGKFMALKPYSLSDTDEMIEKSKVKLTNILHRINHYYGYSRYKL